MKEWNTCLRVRGQRWCRQERLGEEMKKTRQWWTGNGWQTEKKQSWLSKTSSRKMGPPEWTHTGQPWRGIKSVMVISVKTHTPHSWYGAFAQHSSKCPHRKCDVSTQLTFSLSICCLNCLCWPAWHHPHCASKWALPSSAQVGGADWGPTPSHGLCSAERAIWPTWESKHL